MFHPDLIELRVSSNQVFTTSASFLHLPFFVCSFIFPSAMISKEMSTTNESVPKAETGLLSFATRSVTSQSTCEHSSPDFRNSIFNQTDFSDLTVTCPSDDDNEPNITFTSTKQSSVESTGSARPAQHHSPKPTTPSISPTTTPSQSNSSSSISTSFRFSRLAKAPMTSTAGLQTS